MLIEIFYHIDEFCKAFKETVKIEEKSEIKKLKLKSPDQAIRAAKRKNAAAWIPFVTRLDNLIRDAHVYLRT